MTRGSSQDGIGGPYLPIQSQSCIALTSRSSSTLDGETEDTRIARTSDLEAGPGEHAQESEHERTGLLASARELAAQGSAANDDATTDERTGLLQVPTSALKPSADISGSGFVDRGGPASLPEANATMAFPSADAPWYKKLFAFAGLGFLISVGYM